MTEDIFKKARECISEGLIRQLFDCAKSEIYRQRELKTLCPYREDRTIGSFYINLDTGLWVDYSKTGGKDEGDLIDLICKTYNLTNLEAAEKIIHDSGNIVPDKKQKDTKEKEKIIFIPVIPIPEEAFPLLNKHIKSKFIVENFGTSTKGWRCKNPDGSVWMCVVRHIKEDNDKSDIPYHYCTDKKWHAGALVKNKRHLYGIENLKPDSKVLIVEGLKCGDVEVPGFVVLSWWGGAGQIKYYDWSVIKNHVKIMWPDLDTKKFKDGELMPDIQQPGLKTALMIKDKLKDIKILDVYKKFGTAKIDGWDIYDAGVEGVDLVKFIGECGDYEERKAGSSSKTIAKIEGMGDGTTESENKDNADNGDYKPFQFLGFDDGRHYFLPSGSNIVKRISFGSFSKSKILELAPLSYWCMEYPQKQGYDFESAVDDIIRQSESKGYFKPDIVRGAGVWRDQDEIIVNNGKKITDKKGVELKDFKTNYFYVISDKDMGDFKGITNTEEQGKSLIELFLTQGFETTIESMISLGWSLIAPFGGILKWRPHIWITGPKSSGKSWVLENLIHPLCGPFSFTGSGADSAPGLYRSLWKDPAPVIKDEMEPRTKEARKKIDETLEVVRNASSDFSAYKTIANQHGGVDRFCIRSCFCLSSIVPYMTGEAIESRVLVCKVKNPVEPQKKIDKTIDILKTGLMIDPGIFRRQIFKNIESILQNIEILKKMLLEETGDQRKSDNLAPIIAALYNLVLDGVISNRESVSKYVSGVVHELHKSDDQSDEDKLLREIFDYNLRVNGSDSVSIAELIADCGKETATESEQELLLRNGVKLYKKGNKKYLAIATHHSSIKNILRDTMYSANYVNVLERHKSALAKGKNHIQVRFAGQKKYAVHLDWKEIEKKYFGDPDNEDNGPSLFDVF